MEQPLVAQCRSFLLQPPVDVVLDELHSHSATPLSCVDALRRDRRVARNGLRWSQCTCERWCPSESVLMRIGRDCAAHAL